jgi:hypothetical protein
LLIEWVEPTSTVRTGMPASRAFLQPWIDDAQRAENLHDRIGLLRHQRLQLGNQLAVIAAGIDRDRRAAEALHLFDLGIVGLQVEIVVGAGGADGDALALQRQALFTCGEAATPARRLVPANVAPATAANFRISRRPKPDLYSSVM